MPASQRSLQVTSNYRTRLFATRTALQNRAEQLWPTIETFDRTQWVERMAAAVTQAQVEAIRLTSAYLGAFLTSELGRRVDPPALDARAFAGKSFDGQPLSESLRSPLIGVLSGLKQGLGASDSLANGLVRARRAVGVDYDHAHRTALSLAIETDDRFDGSARAVRGTCGACAALSGTPHMSVHPGCQCVQMPSVAGVQNLIPLPTGTELFNAKSPEEQDAMVGPEAAEKLRKGDILITDLIGESHMDSAAPDFLTQKPISHT